MFVAIALVLGLVVPGFGYVVGDDRDSAAVADTGAEAQGARAARASAEPRWRIQPGFEIARAGHPLPEGSGSGRRVVFSESEQRVWLVDAEGEVEATHPVSGSKHDNLFPGTYAVFSRSRNATAYDHSSTMEYFVRFTRGTGGSAIGFHDIPVADGEPVQAFDQLGTPLSAGCIRQRRSDAIAVWEFAPVGTTVVVTD